MSRLLCVLLVVALFVGFAACERSQSAEPTNVYKSPYTPTTASETFSEVLTLTEEESTDAAPNEAQLVPIEKDEPEKVDKGAHLQGNFDGEGVLLDVPFIDQLERYPSGCESISAVMLCNYYGIPSTPEFFIGTYLDMGTAPFRDALGIAFGDDPNQVFLGSPYSEEGWGCYGTVIEKALNKFVPQYGFSVRLNYGLSLQELCNRYISAGDPVVIWATSGMTDARRSMSWYVLGTSNVFSWVAPMHCLVLTGYDDHYYYFNDPQKGKNYRYLKYDVEAPYASFGQQSIVILPAERSEESSVRS